MIGLQAAIAAAAPAVIAAVGPTVAACCCCCIRLFRTKIFKNKNCQMRCCLCKTLLVARGQLGFLQLLEIRHTACCSGGILWMPVSGQSAVQAYLPLHSAISTAVAWPRFHCHHWFFVQACTRLLLARGISHWTVCLFLRNLAGGAGRAPSLSLRAGRRLGLRTGPHFFTRLAATMAGCRVWSRRFASLRPTTLEGALWALTVASNAAQFAPSTRRSGRMRRPARRSEPDAAGRAGPSPRYGCCKQERPGSVQRRTVGRPICYSLRPAYL